MSIAGATRSGAIRIKVPLVNVARPFAEQRPSILAGLEAAGRLLRWYRLHETELIALVAEANAANIPMVSAISASSCP